MPGLGFAFLCIILSLHKFAKQSERVMDVSSTLGITVQWLTPDQAAAILGVKPLTLAVWRSTKRYALPYYKFGRCVRYLMSDLLAFAAANKHYS